MGTKSKGRCTARKPPDKLIPSPRPLAQLVQRRQGGTWPGRAGADAHKGHPAGRACGRVSRVTSRASAGRAGVTLNGAMQVA